jgi:hypothetical protein
MLGTKVRHPGSRDDRNAKSSGSNTNATTPDFTGRDVRVPDYHVTGSRLRDGEPRREVGYRFFMKHCALNDRAEGACSKYNGLCLLYLKPADLRKKGEKEK